MDLRRFDEILSNWIYADLDPVDQISNSVPFFWMLKIAFFSFDTAGIWWSKHKFSMLGLPVTNQGSLLLTKQIRWNLLFACFLLDFTLTKNYNGRQPIKSS